MSETRRAVIIDDESAFAEKLKTMLNGFGYQVTIATDVAMRDALDLNDKDIVFVDIRTPKLSWQRLCQQLSRQQAKAAIVMMGTQFERLEEAEKVAKKLRLNLIGAIEKPFRVDDLRDVLTGAR